MVYFKKEQNERMKGMKLILKEIFHVNWKNILTYLPLVLFIYDLIVLFV